MKLLLTITLLLAIIVIPSILAQQERYYVVTMNYSDAGFSVTHVEVKQLDFLPAPYPEGNYKIQVRRADESIASVQLFVLPEKGYIHDTITDDGIKGEVSDQSSIYLDFYLPYDPKGKEIILIDDKGKTRAVIDVTPFSALTPEEKMKAEQTQEKESQAMQAKQILVPFILLLVILGLGVYQWKKNIT